MKQERRTSIAPRTQAIGLVAAVLAGVLAGSMVFIQVVLVPFWRGIPPAEFRLWFTAHAERIRRLMIPLGAGALAVNAASAVTHLVGRRPESGPAVAAAVAPGGVIAITLTVNEPANHRFTAGSLTDAETRDLLGKWTRWHHVRVALGLAAAAAAARAVAGGTVTTTSGRARPFVPIRAESRR